MARRRCTVIFTLCLGFFLVPVGMAAPTALTVHEWGTVTSRHRPDGQAIGRMNRIDPADQLPAFVHRFDQPDLRAYGKGVDVQGHPDVIMRLETPVIYFYPTAQFDRRQSFDVQVGFRGGLINEFYPLAEARYADPDARSATRLSPKGIGQIRWAGLRLDESAWGPTTDFAVWRMPRAVKAMPLRHPNGEAEVYLFYRGVANLRALFKTRHVLETGDVELFNPERFPAVKGIRLSVPRLWLLHVRDDGAIAYRRAGPYVLTRERDRRIAKLSARFAPADYSQLSVSDLRQEMHAELVAQGLYADEADAMLNTWTHSYFRSAGVRLLYVIPRAWIDHYLPLELSVKAEFTRVLIGRIDLAT